MQEKTEIIVSVICCTNYHENTIAQTIESFVNQKTNFAYEIIVHDDASTDDTTSIVQSYLKKYPGLVKAIIQDENQYSQGKHVECFALNEAKGKYFAYCDGDDYWIDNTKLQQQVDILESNPTYSACVHSGIMRNEITGREVRMPQGLHENRLYSTSEIIGMSAGYFLTASMLFRTKAFYEAPDFVFESLASDYATFLYYALQGPIYYINKDMCVYRIFNKKSWSFINENNISIRIDNLKSQIRMLEGVNMYSNYKYDLELRTRLLHYNFHLRLAQGKSKGKWYGDQIDALYENLRNSVIVKKFNANVLGFYGRGMLFPQFLIFTIDRAIQSVSLPVLSAAQKNQKNLKN